MLADFIKLLDPALLFGAARDVSLTLSSFVKLSVCGAGLLAEIGFPEILGALTEVWLANGRALLANLGGDAAGTCDGAAFGCVVATELALGGIVTVGGIC